jgi:hypothetical protein
VRPAAALALAAFAVMPGCSTGKTGTISLGLTTAPGSTVMDRVTRLHLTFLNPRHEVVVERSERGFDLVVDLEADGAAGALVVNGLDAGGALVATGMTPPVPRTAIDARIVVYMAPPMSVGPAPVALEPARTRASVAALGYGAILAGGDAAAGPSDALEIYNAYDHTLVAGLPMPAARAGVTVAAAASNGVYLFGGAGPGGAPTGTLWFFDTRAQPSGRYTEIADVPELARTGGAAVPTSGDRYLITGAPPIQLASGKITEPEGIAAISSGASVVAGDGTLTAVVVDHATGDLLRLRPDPEPLGAQRKGGLAAALPARRLAVFGGEPAPRDALVIDPATGALAPMPDALAEAYAALAVAATPRFVVIAGVRPGGGSTQIEVLDGETLARRHVASVDDAITAAIALPNEQVLLVGATLQLFTPPPPE